MEVCSVGYFKILELLIMVGWLAYTINHSFHIQLAQVESRVASMQVG